jgi:hypothetical protein
MVKPSQAREAIPSSVVLGHWDFASTSLILLICSFICNMFNDAVNNSDRIAPNDWVTVDNELEGFWEEGFLAWRG